MTTPTHSGQTVTDGIHIAHAFEFADAATRNALVATAADVGKIARQLDNDTWYILSDSAPTWLQIDEGSVTNAAVDAAGAIMHTDISEAEGFVRKVGAEAYEAIKTNLSAVVDPIATDDSAAGYRVGSRWINTMSGVEHVLVDSSPAAAVWNDTTGGGGSGWQDDGVVVRLVATSDNVAIGNTVMLGAEKLRVSGDAVIEGKLTVTGAIDPTSLRLDDASLATFLEQAAGSAAALSSANEGRIIYNEMVQEWQVSENGGAYVPLLVSSGDHGTLTGLGDDDHMQYLPVDGSRAMTGDLDMDGFQILNLGSMNGTRHYLNSPTDPVAPAPTEGDRYYNTVIQEEMRYDGTRMKWLSVTSISIFAGRQSTTGPGQYLRGPGYTLMDSGPLGIPVHKGTLVAWGWTRSDFDGATMEVLVGAAVLDEITSSFAGEEIDDTVDADFDSGVMKVRNRVAGSNNVSDAMAWMTYKRRV